MMRLMFHAPCAFISQNKVVGQGHIFIYIYLICPILFGKLNLREREPCLYHVWVAQNERTSINIRQFTIKKRKKKQPAV